MANSGNKPLNLVELVFLRVMYIAQMFNKHGGDGIFASCVPQSCN